MPMKQEQIAVSAIELDDLIGNEEAAKVLRQQPDTLTHWRHQGIGPEYFRVGRKIFYSRATLLNWIAAQRVVPIARAS
jgi:hypothetical protein